MQEIYVRMKGYIKPFERILALDELESLCRGSTRLTGHDLYVAQTETHVQELQDHLAYWEVVGESPETLRPTRQLIREATTNVTRNGVDLGEIKKRLPFRSESRALEAKPNRRVLRYGPHGIHEYRGKFFPQLVVALLNKAGIGPGKTVVDPMCGSGTTIVEACLHGARGVGMDLNPLSVLMAQTKVDLLRVGPDEIEEEYTRIHRTLLQSPTASLSSSWFQSLPIATQEYLKGWFGAEVLDDLDRVVDAIQSTENPIIRNLFLLSLSNILRTVSWQKVDDLRVRREVRMDIEIDAIRDFLAEVGRSARLVIAHRRVDLELGSGLGTVFNWDARDPWPQLNGMGAQADAVVTSPPYATALPYLDTDRLSLAYLNLIERTQLRGLNHQMIGNREISNAQRAALWEAVLAAGNGLPVSVLRLVQEIDRRNRKSEVGFRRRNTAALLGKYFLDMKDVLENMHKCLRPGAPAFIVVGSNHTIAGGQRMTIDTPGIIREIAEDIGFEMISEVSMDALVSRDIFQHNSGASEKIVHVCRMESLTRT